MSASAHSALPGNPRLKQATKSESNRLGYIDIGIVQIEGSEEVQSYWQTRVDINSKCFACQVKSRGDCGDDGSWRDRRNGRKMRQKMN